MTTFMQKGFPHLEEPTEKYYLSLKLTWRHRI